jgi:diguanylate cyclase (GGDEF)-like protein
MEDLQAANAQLSEMAHIDPLTGLLNRRGLDKILNAEISRAKRHDHQLIALLIDCDDFKQINDSMGHSVGDVVLQHIARRLREALRPTDHIARIGGDEFLVLLPETGLSASMLVAERMRLVVCSTPLMHNPHSVNITLSIGATHVHPDTVSLEEILAQAHRPLRTSKRHGKNRLSTEEHAALDPETLRQQSGPTLLGLKQQLVGESALGLYGVMQPIRAISDRTLIGVELLSRSRLPGFERPDDLFRLAMQHGILTKIDLDCLKTCISLVSKLAHPPLCHINLFPSTILNTPVDRLLDLFQGIDPHLVCIEISEQQMIGDPAALRQPLHHLSQAGVRLAMDDLGFGRSSLETLIVLEPQIVKIDRRLVTGAASDSGRRRSLTRLIHMLRSLDVVDIAEGVEAPDDMLLLEDLNVTAGQGYFLGRPGVSLG